METEIKDTSNKTIEKITLPKEIFGLEVRGDILHTVVVQYLANQRQGTHATKTKGLVRGGGKKPWRQKHTGRARHGSIRSPLWKGGGTTFGPLPRDYSYKVNKKVKRLAVKIALSAKYNDGEIAVVDAIHLEKPRTKDMVQILKNLGVDGKSVLVVLGEKDERVVLSARNIVGVDVAMVSDLNTYEILSHDMLLMTRKALDTMRSDGDAGRTLSN